MEPEQKCVACRAQSPVVCLVCRNELELTGLHDSNSSMWEAPETRIPLRREKAQSHSLLPLERQLVGHEVLCECFKCLA